MYKINRNIFLSQKAHMSTIFFKYKAGNYVTNEVWITFRIKSNPYQSSNNRYSDSADKDVGLSPLVCWDRGVVSRRGPGYLSPVNIICSQVEACASR
jgi:hypothetical protein